MTETVSTPTRRKKLLRSFDAGFFLTMFLFLLFGIRSNLVIAPLGGAGSPALLFGLIGLAWWVVYQVQRAERTTNHLQPVRIALLVFLAVLLASFVVAMRRPIDPDEASNAELGMLGMLSWMGTILLACDGLLNARRLDTMLNRFIIAGTLLAGLGVAQFATNSLLIAGWGFPGLTPNLNIAALIERNGFARPSGTAIHPLEFGATLCTLLPLALTRARFASRRGDHRWWLCVGVMALGIVVSISRSALICATLGLLILCAVWTAKERRWLVVGMVGMAAVVSLTIPGMLGSLRGLFISAPEDNSIASRTGSYDIAFQFFERWPLVGRGYSTFLPKHRIFDNQYLDFLVEIGALGVLSFLGLILTAMWCARRGRALALSPENREIGQALAAGLAAAGLGLALFDGISFPLSTGVLGLMIGVSGAFFRVRQLEHDEIEARSSP